MVTQNQNPRSERKKYSGSKFIRMNLDTYMRLRRMFPGFRGESAASYFDRIVRAWENDEIDRWLDEKRFKIR